MTILKLKVEVAKLEFLREQMELNLPDFFDSSYDEYYKKLNKVLTKLNTYQDAIAALEKIESFE